MQTLKSRYGVIVWVLAVVLLAWFSGEWETAPLECGLILVACVALYAAILSWAVILRSPHRQLIGRLRKMLMAGGSLLGLLIACAPATALPIMDATRREHDPLRRFLVAIALAGLLIAGLALIAPASRTIDQLARHYRDDWQACQRERQSTETDT